MAGVISAVCVVGDGVLTRSILTSALRGVVEDAVVAADVGGGGVTVAGVATSFFHDDRVLACIARLATEPITRCAGCLAAVAAIKPAAGLVVESITVAIAYKCDGSVARWE